jgi:putative ABC transport system substrate-binding protein
LTRRFEKATDENTGALIVLEDNLTFRHRAEIATLANRSRLPAMYGLRDYAQAGGLIAYGPNLAEIYRHSATFVDKILKGAKPADLPVEQPTRFELLLNRKTAKMLNIEISSNLIARADEVID